MGVSIGRKQLARTRTISRSLRQRENCDEDCEHRSTYPAIGICQAIRRFQRSGAARSMRENARRRRHAVSLDLPFTYLLHLSHASRARNVRETGRADNNTPNETDNRKGENENGGEAAAAAALANIHGTNGELAICAERCKRSNGLPADASSAPWFSRLNGGERLAKRLFRQDVESIRYGSLSNDFIGRSVMKIMQIASLTIVEAFVTICLGLQIAI